jgi:hypothetical protein
MTVRQLIRVLIRRWYVVLACMLLTAGALNLATSVNGVYWTQVDAVLLPPNSTNSIEYQNASLVHFAAIIERELNGGSDTAKKSASRAPLYGTGVRNGYKITLPNSGGQWSSNFNRAALAVEVVGSSPERVDQMRVEVLARINDLIWNKQQSLGVAPRDLITVLESPAQPVIRYAEGDQRRASAAVGIMGAGIAIAASRLVDGALNRRRRRHQAPARVAEPAPI